MVNGYRLFCMYMNKYASHIEYVYICIYIIFIYLYLTFIACQISRIRSGYQGGVNTYILNIHIFHTCCARFISFHFVSFRFVLFRFMSQYLNVSYYHIDLLIWYSYISYIHTYGNIYESKESTFKSCIVYRYHYRLSIKNTSIYHT